MKNQHLESLSQLFTSDKIKTDAESLAYYGKDWTTYYDIKASAVVFPTSTEEVQSLVLWANKNKIALVPSGGRTGLSGAACALNDEVIVSFEKMNQIKSLSPIDQTVVVEPGVILETLQDFARENGFFYPIDFAARGSAHIGGSIATNAGGIKVVRYGLTRDWVTHLTVVTGAGEVLKLNKGLIKNATGYDLRQLFIGSEGTLGFITEATLRLAPPPPPLKVLVLGVENLHSVMKIFSEFKTQSQLVAFEMFSDLALNHVLKNTGLTTPFESQTPFYVLAEVECQNSQDEEKILKIFETCIESSWVIDGVISQSDLQAKQFWRYREDISESLAKFSPYKNDISVTISKVPDFVAKLDQILNSSYPTWEVVWFGHVGDGNLHINILRPSGMSKEEFVQECRKVDPLIFQLIEEFDGSISAEHGVGLSKKSFLKHTRKQNEIEIMKGIKKIFDPNGILNPGKIFE